MISVPPPTGAIMAYRLDPYSLEVVSKKPKSMHDVVEPTILFYHRKGPAAAKGAASASAASPSASRTSATTFGSPNAKQPRGHAKTQSVTSTASASSGSSRGVPPVQSSPVPNATKTAAAVRHITVSTASNPCLHLLAPFRVTAGDVVVFQAPNGGEHIGTVTQVFDADYTPSPSSGGSHVTHRLVRKARSVDRETQQSNNNTTANVRFTVSALLQERRPGGFGPCSLSAVEWQLDKSLLYVVLSYDPIADGDLKAVYDVLRTQLKCEVQILTHFSPQSSPALSDCGNSTVSLSETPSLCVGDML